MGAWLVAGAVRSAATHARAPLEAGAVAGVELRSIAPRAGGPAGSRATFRLLASPTAEIDLRKAFGGDGAEAFAFAGGVLRLDRALRGYLALSVDDGVAVVIDGVSRYSHDEPRSPGRDSDLVAVDLPPGDHTVVVVLRQRGGPWQLGMRVTDAGLAAARGARWVLPGVDAVGALASRLVTITLDRGLAGADEGLPQGGYRPRLRVACPGGFPEGAAREVGARAWAQNDPNASVFEVRAGSLPIEPSGPCVGLEVALPPLFGDRAASLEGGPPLVIEAAVGDAKASFTLTPRVELRRAVARADRALTLVDKQTTLVDTAMARATLAVLRERVTSYFERGDPDVVAQLGEARALDEFCGELEAGRDPLRTLRGARRVAYPSPLDGAPSPFGLYLPAGPLDGSVRYPLVVALHGLNGKPMNMMRWVFGHDDPGHDGEWEDRHPGNFEAVDAIVVTPMAYFNSGYRDVGEEDVLAVIDRVTHDYPIDADRVSVTGPSMGGTGTGTVALHEAGRFAAAAPLCGYHTYFLRNDMAGRHRPYEVSIAEHRSNVFWAENGLHLPLFVVHGTRDLPVEYSGVLIDRYKRLGYSVVDEHPDLGHNVWQTTYESLKGMRWLTSKKRDPHPGRVRWKTDDLRYDGAFWLRITRLEHSLAWGEVDLSIARNAVPGATRIAGTTTGVTGVHLTRDPAWPTPDGPVEVAMDGDAVGFGPGEAVDLEKVDGHWVKAGPRGSALHKKGGLAGPLRDVFHDPLILVYGTLDGTFSRANEEVAHWFARVRPGVDIHYPVVADVDFDPALAATHSLVLVGGGDTNSVTRSLDAGLPIHVSTMPPVVKVGELATDAGEEAGAAFIYPNPAHSDRNVVVIAGTTVAGVLRATSLPDFLPDYVVFDRRLAPARGQLSLAPAAFVVAGSFDENWHASR